MQHRLPLALRPSGFLWLTLLTEVGNQVVTASDAHDPADVNRDLEQARARLIQFGVRCA